MKTSNKILLAFIGCLFATPLLISMSLKNKIRNNDFVVKTNGDNEYRRAGTFSKSRVIKIQSPEKTLLNCYLKPADMAAYSYTLSMYKDSARIFNTNDTLFVEYVQNGDVMKKEYGNDLSDDTRSVDVYLDLLSFEKLEINKANVEIDSVPPAVDLLDISLILGSFIVGNMEDGKESHVKELHVTATDSELLFGPKFSAGSLYLNVDGLSNVDLQNARVNEVKGSLSDNTKTKGSWKNLKQLTVTPGK